MTENKPKNDIFRGSGWEQHRRLVSPAYRYDPVPGKRYGNIGIRLVEVIEDPTPDPAPSGSDRVDRGGGWYDDPQYARVANRYYNTPGYRYYSLGVRLVEVVLEEE